MAVITRDNIVSPTSETIAKIQESENELIAVMGIEKFKEMGLNDSVNLCEHLVAYVLKYANEEQKGQIKAIFPDNKGMDSIAQACLKMRELINLNILPGSEQGKECVDQFESGILEMMDEPVSFSKTFTCEMAIDKSDLEMLKRLKKLNRGWSKELAQIAKDRLEFVTNKAKLDESKKIWKEEVVKASAVLEWVSEELKKDEKP